MPEQNQPINGAFGQIYNASLPELQQTEQQIGQQQIYQQRMAQQQTAREQAMYDRMQNQEIGKVMSADEPDVINAYSAAKNAQIAADTYKGKDMQQANNLNRAAVQNWAQAAQLVQQSAERKGRMTDLLQQYKDPNKRALLSDNFSDLMNAYQNTPTSKLKDVVVGGKHYDLSDMNNFMYQGSNYPQYDKINKNAIGTPGSYIESNPMDKNGIAVENTAYKTINPAQYKSNLAAELSATPQGQRFAQYQYANLTQDPNYITNLNNRLRQIPAEQLKRRIGTDDLSTLEPVNPNDPVEAFASIQAKNAILNTPESVVRKSVEINPERRDQLNQALRLDTQKTMEAIKFDHQKDLIPLRAQWAQLSAQNQNDALNYMMDQQYVDASKNKPIQYVDPNDNKPHVGYEVNAAPLDKKIFDKKVLDQTTGKLVPQEPDAIRWEDSGSMVRPIRYLRDDSGNYLMDKSGNKMLDPDFSKPISKEQYMSSYGDAMHNAKFILQNPNAPKSVPTTTPTEKTYNFKGTKVSESQLLKTYTKQQIEDAKKAGVLQ
jgi:hypothetical protein